MGRYTNVLYSSVGFTLLISCLLISAWLAPAAQQATDNSLQEEDRMVFSHSLPKLNGGNLKVTLVEVTYGPGESSPPHSHPCPVIGYVVRGELRTKVKGEPEQIYEPGETFYEPPNGVHEISANASRTGRTKFVAYFICDRDVPLDVALDTLKGGNTHDKHTATNLRIKFAQISESPQALRLEAIPIALSPLCPGLILSFGYC